MRWKTPTQKRSRLERTFTEAGVCVRPNPMLQDEWWTTLEKLIPEDHDLADYLDQLLDEERAKHQTDNSVLLPWDAIYAIREHEEHQDSIALLKLPNIGDWVPVLSSSGAPSDADFKLSIAAWRSACHGEAHPKRRGALLMHHGQTSLMRQEVWACVKEVLDRSKSSSLHQDESYRPIGTIQRLARDGGAVLNDYLEKTSICTPDKLGVEFIP